MTDPCSRESLKKARRKIEQAAFIAFADKIMETREIAKALKEILEKHGLKILPGLQAFSDGTGSVFELSKLRTRLHMKRYNLPIDVEAYISRYAGDLQNNLSILDQKISKSAIDNVMHQIEESCSSRKYYIETYGNQARKIVGKYTSFVSPIFYYHFTDRPEDIFRKSTGQTWSPHNCERYGGDSQQGIFSDIEHGSVVVFLRKKKSPKFHARLMLRVCVYGQYYEKVGDEEVERYLVSFGYDKYWYRGNDSHERFTVNQSKRFDDREQLTARIATREVLDILKSKGFSLDYQECKTPYVHEGYSDVEQRKKTSITYSPVYKECPECGEIVPVDRRGVPRCNRCSERFTCRECGGSIRLANMSPQMRNVCIECYRRTRSIEDQSEEDE